MTKYRILTEDRNRPGVRAIVDRYFEGYTIIHALGCWRGKAEASLIIEIVPPDTVPAGRDPFSWSALGSVLAIAAEIKLLNGQECVMIEQSEIRVQFV